MKKNSLVLTIILVIIISALGFFGGMQYQKTQVGNFAEKGMFNGIRPGMQNQQTGQQGINQPKGNRGNGPLNGEITAKDDKSITVKTIDGSSKIVIISDSTTVSKTEESSKEDLKVGETVAAFGTTNSDGSITAQNIQLNPLFKNNPLAK